MEYNLATTFWRLELLSNLLLPQKQKELIDKIDKRKISILHSTCDDNPYLPQSYIDNLDELQYI